MKSAFSVIYLIVIIFLCPELSYGQKNIGEFSRSEGVIRGHLDKEFKALGCASSIGFGSREVSAYEFSDYIIKVEKTKAQ